MERRERIKKFLKDPGVWLWAFYAALAALIAACVCVLVLWDGENPVAYALYALSAALFGYCVYASVAPVKRLAAKAVKSNRLTARMARDYGFRTAAFAAASFAVNLAYAILQGVLGIVLHSYWYGLFAGYYLVLSIMRGAVLLGGLKAGRREDEALACRGKLRIYLGCGGMLIILSAAFAALASFLIISEQPPRYGMYGAIMMAMYTFYKIIAAAINAVKVKKYGDFALQAIRNVTFADALVSVFALQTAMVATFAAEGEAGEMHSMNVATGAVVFLLTLGLGIYMIVRAAKGLYKIKRSAGGGNFYCDGMHTAAAQEDKDERY